MEGVQSRPQSKPKFSIYQNPAFSAALTAKSIQPSKSTFLFIFSISTASFAAFLAIISRWKISMKTEALSFACNESMKKVLDTRSMYLGCGENGFINNLRLMHFSWTTAYFITKMAQMIVGFVLLGTLSALVQALLLYRARKAVGISISKSSASALKGKREQGCLTARQQGLLGLRLKPTEQVDSGLTKKPPKSRPYSTSSPSDILVPLHHSAPSSNRSSRIGSEKLHISGGKSVASYVPSVSPGSTSSPFLVSPSAPMHASDRQMSTPWSKQQSNISKKIQTEAMLEQFLADVDEKITDSTVKGVSPSQSHMTPPLTLHAFGSASPSTIPSSATASGTARSTPLRPVRISPGSQKYTTPPKKGEGDLPPPMTMEQTVEAFENLGIYPHIEQGRDHLRQWFSSVLLNPLVEKIETSHFQVMQAAAKLGISINVSQVGSGSPNAGAPASMSPIDGMKEWQPTFTLDEDGLLHQLRAALVQYRDGSASQLPLPVLQHPQQNPSIPVIQECVDAITEHQRLQSLMKGDWLKGLLPQRSVRADYTVQRVRELAEGTCLKNYEYLGNGEVYDKVNKKWTLELPTDSHLLLYLFCAFLEHPKWMLHVDPSSYASAQSSKNPLFLGVLPPKERFPEKYVAVIAGVPSVLHPGACILAVGKQSPPIFALYWDKKLHFSLQGRTALWDAILLACHRIKLGYGGVVRGLHLGSSALNILPIFNSEAED